MKSLLIINAFLFTSIIGFGQTMQASIGTGSASTNVIIYIKPDLAVNGYISTLQFDVAIDPSVTPVPSLSVVSTPTIVVTWNIDPSYVEGGYRHYQFTTAASPLVTIGAGVETEVMELKFSGGPVTANNVSLVTLPQGGSTGNALYLCTGAANSIEGQLYYARSGTTVVNNTSYTGTLTSYATLSGIILPVNWLSFDVVKQGNNALLNWSVGNDEATHNYEVQRSNNGINFTTISTLNISANASYNYSDLGITNLGSSVLYYRIKQTDIDGRISYSSIRMLRLDLSGTQISIYPNPVKDGFYLNILFINPDNRKLILNLFSANGQLICSKEITMLQAANYYFDIKGKAIAAGNYNLQIIFENKIMETKTLFINQ